MVIRADGDDVAPLTVIKKERRDDKRKCEWRNKTRETNMKAKEKEKANAADSHLCSPDRLAKHFLYSKSQCRPEAYCQGVRRACHARKDGKISVVKTCRDLTIYSGYLEVV